MKGLRRELLYCRVCGSAGPLVTVAVVDRRDADIRRDLILCRPCASRRDVIWRRRWTQVDDKAEL